MQRAALVASLILLIGITSQVLAVTDTFSASASVGNEGPVIYVDTSQQISGQAGQTASVYVFFNASDANGAGDLNTSTASVTINMTGFNELNSTGCVVNNTIDTNTRRYNCTISLPYYTAPGTWSINATITDNSSNTSYNDTVTLTVNNLDAVAVDEASISFSGSPGTSDIASSPEPQRLNNTGNQIYSSVNLTGYDFLDGSTLLAATNVTFNVTDSNGPGQTLLNATEFTISNANLTRGGGIGQDIYFWLDIPASQPSGSYTSEAAWILEAII